MKRSVTINRKEYEVTVEITRENVANAQPLTAANMERNGQAALLTVKRANGKKHFLAIEFVNGVVQML